MARSAATRIHSEVAKISISGTAPARSGAVAMLSFVSRRPRAARARSFWAVRSHLVARCRSCEAPMGRSFPDASESPITRHVQSIRLREDAMARRRRRRGRVHASRFDCGAPDEPRSHLRRAFARFRECCWRAMRTMDFSSTVPFDGRAQIEVPWNLLQIGKLRTAVGLPWTGFEWRGLDSSCAGLDSSSAGLDSSCAGLDSSCAGLDSSCAGLDSSCAGPDSSSAGPDSSSAGPDSSSAGPDSSSSGPDSSSAGLDSSSAGLDSSSSGPDSSSARLVIESAGLKIDVLLDVPDLPSLDLNVFRFADRRCRHDG
jgi:hypothetical protein